MKIVIMRGFPCAGKSTWVRAYAQAARDNNESVVICSADDYHVDPETGVYCFDPKKAGVAHEYCFEHFLAGIATPQLDHLVVDNTNIHGWELAPYYRLAAHKRGPANVRIVRVHAEFGDCLARNNGHNVPPAVMWAMWQGLHTERLPPFWNEEIVSSHDAWEQQKAAERPRWPEGDD